LIQELIFLTKKTLPKIRKQSTDINVEENSETGIEATVEATDKVTDEAEVEEVTTRTS